MFDLITLSLLWFFTAGVSGIAYLAKVWDGGLYWFWVWNLVMVIVAAFELYLYLRFKVTLTRTLTRSETDTPLSAKHKWIARTIIICYVLGVISLAVHLWPWK